MRRGEIAGRRDPDQGALALECCTRSLALVEELGMTPLEMTPLEVTPLEARCRLMLGALHQRAGRIGEARSGLQQAHQLLRRMEMRAWLSPAETQPPRDAAGGQRAPSRGRASPPAPSRCG
jgi:hypothetical protein